MVSVTEPITQPDCPACVSRFQTSKQQVVHLWMALLVLANLQSRLLSGRQTNKQKLKVWRHQGSKAAMPSMA